MFAILVIVAGLTGTVCMSLVMWFIHERGYANADMIRAVGSLVTRRYENSLGPGLLLHLTAGCLFAIPYVFILRAIGITSFWVITLIGTALGTFHGAAMVFILMALSEKHPVPRFQETGPSVAWAHVVGHMAYGTGVGAMVGLVGPHIGELIRSVSVHS